PRLCHLSRDLDFWIKVTDALLRFVAHPLAIVTNVFSQTLRAPPDFAHLLFLLLSIGVHRRLARELRRDLDHRFADENGDGIQVAGIRFESESLRLQWQRATTGKGIVEGGQLMPVEEFFRTWMTGILGAG